MNPFSHIDLRVNNLEGNLPFYESFLSALGFIQTFHSEKWKVFAANGNLPSVAYFAITEDPLHKPNGNLVGFWVENRDKVDRLAALIKKSGGKITSGPQHFPLALLTMQFILKTPVEYEIVHRLN
ncbi:hypothetical protein KIS4809_2905 [Bacillus sp. ZZV12-4809]|nr:hypothetical protein KIS4809_2905 [Bacillus sp. ZZV12-4809]